MKQQVTRLSPHQNGKVFAILMANTALVVFVPMLLIASMFAPEENTPHPLMVFLIPILYLVMGYIAVAAACVLYNIMCRFIGGVEFESNAVSDKHDHLKENS
ncbi:hypothetical protein LX59_01295 [Azomonas agilis]|uniref:DUF3566 domain-containing protein n=1 Tax=Azomonas agilis TaxID=116849 RepID=A0A562IYV0_9GAMM|nr:hypothetical protein [Azomonas agilis]TWH75785.1 hypothetical protein LX59_01295 [Azomonas agilis]